MSLVRRLALGLLTVALLAGAAVAAGYAMRAPSSSPAAVAPDDAPRPRPAPTPPPVPTVEPTPSVTPTPTPTPTPHAPARPLEPGRTLQGPGDEGDEVRDLQARLAQIAWFFGDVDGTYGDLTTEAVRGFQEKRRIPVTGEVDQRTLDRLLAMTNEPTRDQLGLHNIAGPLDARCLSGRVMCVDKTTRTIRWVVDGEVQKTMDVRFGGSSTPTREGLFTVGYKSRDHHSRLYDTDMPFAMFFSGGQAVHFSPDFAAVGYNGASHGCVNVRDYEGVSWLFDQVAVGDEVVVYWS